MIKATGFLLLGVVVVAGPGCNGTDGTDGGPVVDPPTIRFVAPSAEAPVGAVEVSGMAPSTAAEVARRISEPGAASSVLAVHTTAAAADPGSPPVSGAYDVDGHRLVFVPRFPFATGMSYRARFNAPGGGAPVELTFSIPEPSGPGETVVMHVYPSADTWPMNQLKMYVRFSAPMRHGRAFEHIRLIDADSGEEVEQPFATVQEELWDRERRTLTVLYDPGRIKRGLVPNEQAGLPLQVGRSYRLVIDGAWPDATGRSLSQGFERRFSVGPLDRSSPHPRDWRIVAPRAGSDEPVSIAFGEPIDHGLLQTLISVRRAGNSDAQTRIEGRVEILAEESVWSFTPDEGWEPGRYELVVPTMLEDLAGNTLRSLFDVDLQEAPNELADQDAVVLGFVVEDQVFDRPA